MTRPSNVARTGIRRGPLVRCAYNRYQCPQLLSICLPCMMARRKGPTCRKPWLGPVNNAAAAQRAGEPLPATTTATTTAAPGAVPLRVVALWPGEAKRSDAPVGRGILLTAQRGLVHLPGGYSCPNQDDPCRWRGAGTNDQSRGPAHKNDEIANTLEVDVGHPHVARQRWSVRSLCLRRLQATRNRWDSQRQQHDHCEYPLAS